VALDRQSIQRKDFSMSRRGYDPAEVDAHLSAIADEVVALQATSRGGDTLASSASDHVRAIVEAAETSAAQIRSEAESQADATRREAEQHAQMLSSSSAAMLERLEATKRELEGVIETLRTGVGGIETDGGPPDPSHGAAAEPVATAGNGAGAIAPAEVQPDSSADDAAGVTADREPPSEAVERAAAVEEPVEHGSAATSDASQGASADAEAARLIALNMALNGTPRDETAEYLAQHYELSDRDRLLDEVYASLEG
jgi:DivIVA domain-containing protein